MLQIICPDGNKFAVMQLAEMMKSNLIISPWEALIWFLSDFRYFFHFSYISAKLLNMDVVTLQFLMRQDRLPIGYAIKKDGKSRYHYIIYKSMLDTFIQGGGKG